jgi:mRNA interferase MazF
MDPRSGEVYVVDLGIAGKVRPAVVVSRYDPDRPLALVTIAPVTSQNRGSAYEVALGLPMFLRENSWVNVQAISSVDPRQFQRKIGSLNKSQMEKLHAALAYLLEIPSAN